MGAFLTGPSSGALHTAGASCNTGTAAVIAGAPCVTSAQMTSLGPQLAFLGRASYQVVQTQDATLHLGFNYANLLDPRVDPNEMAVPLFDRPELRVDPTYFLNTGNIPATGGQVFGVEAAASLYDFFVQGEYYHYAVDTRAGVTGVPGNLQRGVPGPTLNFNGGYAEASYTFDGKRFYDPTRGAYTEVIPEVPLAPGSLVGARLKSPAASASSISTARLSPPPRSAAPIQLRAFLPAAPPSMGAVSKRPRPRAQLVSQPEHEVHARL